jgi:hypothetical protein
MTEGTGFTLGEGRGFSFVEQRLVNYGVFFPLEALRVVKDLKQTEWMLFLLLAGKSRAGNRVRVDGRQLQAWTGWSESLVYRRLKILRDKGLILGITGGYILSGRVFWRGRLHQLEVFQDEFDERYSREVSPGRRDEGEACQGEEADEAGPQAGSTGWPGGSAEAGSEGAGGDLGDRRDAEEPGSDVQLDVREDR